MHSDSRNGRIGTPTVFAGWVAVSQAGQQRGESMCYNLVEWLKEQLLSFYALKPPPTAQVVPNSLSLSLSPCPWFCSCE
jgi:hypothetical protein